MKNKLTSNYARLLASVLFLLLFSVKSFCQTGYDCSIKNITNIDSKTIHFDIWIGATGGANMKLQGFQSGVKFNYDSLANGGTITGQFVTGSADASLPAKEQAPSWRVNPTSHMIQLFTEIIIPDSAATVIPSSTSGGIMLGTMELKNTVDFTSGVTPNFCWYFGAGGSTATKTVVSCYVNGAATGTRVTDPSHHSVIH